MNFPSTPNSSVPSNLDFLTIKNYLISAGLAINWGHCVDDLLSADWLQDKWSGQKKLVNWATPTSLLPPSSNSVLLDIWGSYILQTVLLCETHFEVIQWVQIWPRSEPSPLVSCQVIVIYQHPVSLKTWTHSGPPEASSFLCFSINLNIQLCIALAAPWGLHWCDTFPRLSNQLGDDALD